MIKYLLLIPLLLLSNSILFSQSIVFSENFESTSIQFTSSSTGSGQWSTTQLFAHSGVKSDSCVVTQGDTIYLTSNSFSVPLLPFVRLRFSQICKIEFLDKAIIEISTNNGISWTKVTGAYYKGKGIFTGLNNSFDEISYPMDWAANSNTTPTNNWWKHEVFNLSSQLTNQNQVKIRFALIDGNNNGSAGRYGWLIDSVVVEASSEELDPPKIQFTQLILQDSVYNFGPYYINVKVTDQSSIDTVMLIYSRNGGIKDTIGMIGAGAYQGIIDTLVPFSVGDTICYQVVAIDATQNENKSIEPGICKQFIVHAPVLPPNCNTIVSVFPYMQDFESATAGIGTPTSPGVFPNGWSSDPNSGYNQYTFLIKTGSTTTPYTGPKNDHTTSLGNYVYAESSYGSNLLTSYLYSPCFDISSLNSPKLEFWYHMFGKDATEFSVQIWFGNSWLEIWNRSGSQKDQWEKASISLITYRGITKLRFKTVKNGTNNFKNAGDIALDDISVIESPLYDVGITQLLSPVSPINAGTKSVNVVLSNFGSATINSANIDWSYKGQYKGSVTYSGLLNPSISTQINLGNENFTSTGAPLLKFWSSNPNGFPDAVPENNVLKTSVLVCEGPMSGTYTVGNDTADFYKLSDAIEAIETCGIIGPVVFELAAGTYNEPIVINSVTNLTTIKTLTIKGRGRNTTFSIPTGMNVRNVITIKDTRHVIFDSLCLTTSTNSANFTGLHIMNNADSNIIRNCIIEAPHSTSIFQSTSNGIVFSNSVNLSTSCKFKDWVIENNIISGGGAGILLNGDSASSEGIRIINNEIYDCGINAIYIYHCGDMTINNNYIHFNPQGYSQGININSCYNGLEISKNRMILRPKSSTSAISIWNFAYGTTNTDSTIITNNMISVLSGTSTNRGIGLVEVDRVNIYYNNILMKEGNGYTSPIALQSSIPNSIKLLNNSLINLGNGVAHYMPSNPNIIAKSNYNNFYTAGSSFAYWSTGFFNSFSAYKTISGLDSLSDTLYVKYKSEVDLHTGIVELFKKGMFIASPNDDYDGDSRSTIKPCIGADEYRMVGNDAGIPQLVSPQKICANTQVPVKVELYNYGADTLFTVTIGWSLDNVTQTSISYSDTLLPGESDTVFLGNKSFASLHSYKFDIWTSSPNNMVDSISSNDSLTISSYKTLIPSGTYTVGGNTADFPIFDSLISQLNNWGICGPVTFKINSGLYNSQLYLDDIYGSSDFNSISFTSVTGDSSDVIFNITPSYSVSSTVHLSNISYVSISDITFKLDGDGHAIEMLDSVTNCNISNSAFILPNTKSINASGVFIDSYKIQDNMFSNNLIEGAFYGIYASGNNMIDKGHANEFKNNTIKGFSGYGIFAKHQDSIIISSNLISNGSYSTNPNGVFLNSCTGKSQLFSNNIQLQTNSYAVGIQLLNVQSISGLEFLVANNMLNIEAPSLNISKTYGLRILNSMHVDVVYNSLMLQTLNNGDRTLYVDQGSNISIQNNIISSKVGIPYYVKTSNAITNSDYNLYYSQGNTLAYWSSLKSSLADLQSINGKDQHSVNSNPNFFPNNDLHIYNSPADSAATPINGITKDIDNEARNTNFPDIGADEFTIPTIDVSMLNVLTPQSACGLNNEDVIVQIVNSGLNTVSSINLKFSLDSGQTYISETYNQSILSRDTLTYTFTNKANLASTIDKFFTLWVIASTTNDAIPFNDTIKAAIYNRVRPTVPTVSNVTTPFATATTLYANSPNPILWYSDSINIALNQGLSYNTPILFDTSIFYATSTSPTNGCISHFVPDTVFVTGIPVKDIGISEIIVSEGCGLSSSENISIKIYNQGSTTISNGISAHFRIGNTWTSLESISATLIPHDTITYVFTGTANLLASVDTVFELEAKVILSGDAYFPNDSLIKNITASYTPTTPIVSSPVSITNGNNAILTATSSDSLFWYAESTDTIPLSIGSSYVTPYLFMNDTFYVQANHQSCKSPFTSIVVNVSSPIGIDAALYSLENPVNSVAALQNTPIKVKVKNYGVIGLTSVDIVYELNNIIKDTLHWSGTLLSGDTSSAIVIANDKLPLGNNVIRCWVQNANNTNQGVNNNDTLLNNIHACLNGSYTVGDSTSDFLTINSAVQELITGGICGPVIFNIKTGSYNTLISINAINGSSMTNSIVFQSQSGDSTDVVIETGSGSLLVFNGAKYIKFKHVSLSSSTPSSASVVSFINNAHHISVENCIITSSTASSSSIYGISNGKYTKESHITIRNNHILNGYAGIDFSDYVSGLEEEGNIIENNLIENFSRYGIVAKYQDTLSIKSNVIRSGNLTSSNSNAIRVEYCLNNIFIESNNILMQNIVGAGAIVLNNCTPQSYIGGGLIINNMVNIENATGTTSGMSITNLQFGSIYNNTVNISGSSVGSNCILVSTSSLNVKLINNILVNTAGGSAFGAYGTVMPIILSDYNNFYTTGSLFVTWNGSKSNLTELQSYNGMDAHSISMSPDFLSASDIHSSSIAMNDKGIFLVKAYQDIDQQSRSISNPDIGADEYDPALYDVSLLSMDAPVSPGNSGSQNVHISFENLGVNTLTSVSIDWEVNSVVQPSYLWTGSLASLQKADSVSIGSYSFGLGINKLKFWPNSPNNNTDQNHLNDTIETYLVSCTGVLSGAYTIGGTSPNFNNFEDALTILKTCGIGGNVVFNIAPGTYNEYLHIDSIPGLGANASITFQSSTGDSTDVVLTASSTNMNDYVIFIDGADYLRFNHMSIVAASPSMVAIRIENEANNNHFVGNILKTPNSISSSSHVINSGFSKDDNNIFRYNLISGSYYAVEWQSNTLYPETGNIFEHNTFENYYKRALSIGSQNGILIKHNTFETTVTGNSWYYSIHLFNCKSFDFSYNTINVQSNGAAIGLSLSYCNSPSTAASIVTNNTISMGSSVTSTYNPGIVGIKSFNSQYIDFLYNNINIDLGFTSNNSVAMAISSGSNCHVLNNNLVNASGGYAYQVPYFGVQSDYNNFYASDSLYFINSYFNLQSYINGTGLDSNSLNVDPQYTSIQDLHISNTSLNGSATPVIGVIDDIDGDIRNIVTPDIGADEIDPKSWDASVIYFNLPKAQISVVGSNHQVSVRFRNRGLSTITSLNVGFSYNGTNVTQNWVGSLLPGDTTSILFTTNLTTLLGNNTLKAYTMLTSDGDLSNDTLSIVLNGLPIITPSYCDNFDSTPSIWASSDNQWEHGIPNSTIIDSAYSAPNAWMTGLSMDYSNNAESMLYTPYFDFSAITSDAIMHFQRNNQLKNDDRFNIEYTTNDGITWTLLGYIGDTSSTNWYNGQINGQHFFTGNTTSWVFSSITMGMLNQSPNLVQFRFHFISNSIYTGEGVAIDNFCIEVPKIANDVGVISIQNPKDTTKIGSMYPVSIKVKNFGLQPQSIIPVSYQANSLNPVVDTIHLVSPILPDSITTFTFTNQYIGLPTSYSLCAMTALPGDINIANDKNCKMLVSIPGSVDAGIIRIIDPKDTISYGINYVKVRIKNFGTTPITSCPVNYYSVNAANTVTETWTGNALQYGDSVDFTFITTFNPVPGFSQFCAFTSIPNDVNPNNDNMCMTNLASSINESTIKGFKLWQNQPNPAFESTTIFYEIPTNGNVVFKIINMYGQIIFYEEDNQRKGSNNITINTSKYTAGVYLYFIEYKGYRLTKKLIINK